jgi:hypothetical protein
MLFSVHNKATKFLISSPKKHANTAQFTFTVVNRPHYAKMVQSLDLSQFNKDVDSTGEFIPMAGWREFKYRHHDMFYVYRHSSPSSYPYKSISTQRALGLPLSHSNSTHPAPSPLLKSFHRTRDVPIGGIFHVLISCTRIKSINFSRLQLASDFAVLSPKFICPPRAASATQVPYPNYFLSEPDQSRAQVTFVSDVPKSWTWKSSELVPIYADSIISLMCQMKELESLEAQHCVWLTSVRVWKLMRDAVRGKDGIGGLKRVDLRESGMQKGIRWAVKGSRAEVERIIEQVMENSPTKVG